MDEAGGIAFRGIMKGSGITITNRRGLWWRPAGATALQLLARQRGVAAEALPLEPVPAGVGALPKWNAFTSLALQDGGRGPLFVARLINRTGATLPVLPGPGGVSPANDVGLWAMDSTGTLRLLVREGDVITGKTVRRFTVLSSAPGSPAQRRSFNSAGQVVYRAFFTDGSQAVLVVQIP